jgi:NAD(P)-dependent dehydrogenase (short-subunit alcohol dehydrogenase family)
VSQQPVVLVTGATDGIGRATAVELARGGATVLVHGRDERRGSEVADAAAAAGTGSARLLTGDLSSLAEARRLADRVREEVGRLDVLVNNAGVARRGRDRQLTADGFELTFAVNHLAHFLLTVELLDLLRASAAEGVGERPPDGLGRGRVVTVSSELHASGRLDFDNLQGERRYDGTDAYARSKLANVLFTRALARRTAGSGVTANALHPGVVHTKLLRDGWGSSGGTTIERGAETSVYLAASPEVAGVTGGYFVSRQKREPAPAAQDDAVAERLWAESERLVAPWRTPG